MYTKIIGEQQVQILSPNFSISPSNEDYVLNISANGRDFSPLFAVSAGVTRLVSNVAPGSYYKLVGNRSEVVINWQRMCATDGGSFDPTVLDPYWTSAQTVDYVDGVVASGINLDAYWTSAETQSAITAVEDHLFDVEQVTASALTELHDGLLEVSARTVDLSGFWTSAETQDAIDEAISGFTPATNSPIIPAITTQAEYEAISGDVKTGDLIQVYDVDINDDGNSESGLFGATVEEEEYEGVVRKLISWARRDNGISVFWSEEDYPWMVDNDVNPIELPGNGFLISPDMTAEDEEYNGIGFDGDGKPVITHFAPQYDEETGEVTGITREDTPIGGGADMSAYYTSAQTEEAITSKNYVTSAQVETQIVSKNYITSAETANFVTSAQVETQIEAKNYVNSGDVKSQVEAYNYATVSQIPTVPTSNTAFTNDAGYITDAAIKNLVTSAQVETQITSKGYATVSQIPTVPTSNTAFTNDAGYITSAQVETQIVEKNYITSAAIANMVTSTSVSTIWKGTQAQYDAIATKDPNTFYIIVSN